MNRRLIAVILASVAGSVAAQQALKPEEMIKTRKAAYGFMAWNMGKIKSNLDGGFNKEQVAASGAAVAAVANSGLGALFGPGSERDVGEQKTRVKPEFFQHPDRVRELAMNFNKEANELARLAATGDSAAIKVQFGKTGATCKACHDAFRKD